MRTRLIYMFAMFCTLFAACDKADGGAQTPQPIPDPIGTYSFDGKQYDLRTAIYSESDGAYQFFFSPLLPDSGKFSTYIWFGLLRDFANGRAWNAGQLYHNYDYYLVYEDPVRMFSQYWQLQGGTLLVADKGNNVFHVKIDVKLIDGTPLSIDYEGEFLPDWYRVQE